MADSLAPTEVADKTPTRVRYWVVAWLCAAATIAYVDRNPIGVAEKIIRRDLGLTTEQMGLVMSGFFVSYAIFQIPSGWLGHVWGTRKSLSAGSAMWSVAMGTISLASGPFTLIASRLVMGAAQAGLFPCSAHTMAQWFPSKRRALVSGLLGSFMSVGSALGSLLTGLLLEPLGWRWLFFLFALPGIAWSLWFFIWFRDRPEDHPEVNAAELSLIQQSFGGRIQVQADPQQDPVPWKTLIKSRSMRWICGQQFFRAAGYTFFVSWFPTFLQETRGVSIRDSGILASLPQVAVIVGGVTGGAISDWLLVRTGSRRVSRKGLAIGTLLTCALLTLLAYPIRDVWLAVSVISAGSFLAALAGPCAYAVTIDMGGKHVAPVFSTMNMSGNVGAMIFPLVVPLIVRWAGSWDPVLLFFAGIYLAAAIFWMFLNPDGTVFDPAASEPAI